MVGHRKHPRERKPPGQAASQEVPRSQPPSPATIARPTAGERVAKVLARAGVASRREVERLIAGGKVALNGDVLSTPAVIVGPDDVLTVEGQPVAATEPTRLFRYHKPAGLVTSHHDPRGRPTVFAALPAGLPRVISVGRLDLNSEGLLLLTNDGELARALELPSSGWQRRYRARAYARPGTGIDQARLDTLKDGITVAGVRYGAIDARLDKAREGATGANLWLTVALTEGKNREVRRVLEALGLTVNRLIRVSYGPFALGALAAGAVEEVGPRVIREQLAGFVAPQSMPAGDRALFKAPAGASRRDPAKAKKGDPPPPITYKPGWARPKKRPIAAGAKQHRARKTPGAANPPS
jgi:23S rRNA pseudouridine2605 synthase